MRVRLERRREDVRGWVLPAAILAVLAVGAAADLRCAPAALDPVAQSFLAEAVAPRLAPGDVVLVAPPFRAEAVAAVLGRPVRAGYPKAAPSPVEGAARDVWIVAEEAAALPRDAGWAALPPEPVAESDGWQLRRLPAPGGEPVLLDLWHAFERATAAVERNGAPRECVREPEGRLRCGPDGWNFVGRYVAALGGAPRRCLWAHPVSGATLQIRFPDVPFGPGRTLRGGYGIVDGTPEGAPVQLRVRVGEAVRLRQTIPGKPGGWRSFTLRGDAKGAPVTDLTFELETAENRWRLVCLDAVVTGRDAAAPADAAAPPDAAPASDDRSSAPRDGDRSSAPRDGDRRAPREGDRSSAPLRGDRSGAPRGGDRTEVHP